MKGWETGCLKRLRTVILIVFAIALPAPSVMAETVVVRQLGFEQLRKGSAGDSGANLYVSRQGRIQTINRWDLNLDGELDLLFTQDHNSVYNPDSLNWGGPQGFSKAGRVELEGYTSIDASVADLDRDGHLDITVTNYKSDTTRDLPAFVYWGGAGRDYGKHRRTLLRAASSSAVDTLDLDRDGWVDLVVSNHQEAFDHGAGTNIFWGSSEGISWSRRSHLPTVGVHLDAMVDSGNVYDRSYQWDYLSPPLEAPADTRFRRLSWSGETPLGTGLRFQLRTASRREDLDGADWVGPQGKDSFYLRPGSELPDTSARHPWLQYRAIFTSPDGGNSAILKEVILECE